MDRKIGGSLDEVSLVAVVSQNGDRQVPINAVSNNAGDRKKSWTRFTVEEMNIRPLQ